MPLLTARGIQKSYGVTVLLDGAELHIRRGERLGLVGLNGSGKSSLMRILAGIETVDAGELAWRKGVVASYLPQHPESDESETLLAIAIAGAARGGHGLQPYELVASARRQLAELGVDEPEQAVAEASGGTRRKAALAAVLLEEPDLLLLDEPTNHLDVATVAWLERKLTSFAGAIVLVTHDRYFLNAVVTRIIEIRKQRLWSWPGAFEDYLIGRLEQENLESRTEHSRKRKLASELVWLRRSPKARTTKQKARLQRAHELMQTDYEATRTVRLQVRQGMRLGKSILDADKLDVGFAGFRPLIERLQLAMVTGMRIGVVGANGVGKTTLLRTIAAELPVRGGTLRLGLNTTALYIDQERSGLDPEATVRESASPSGGDWIESGDPLKKGGGKQHIASYLEGFLFFGDDLRQKVATLSGGQRFRLLLARRLLEPMNLLLLDEPTNDLDFETLHVLEEALISYPGCLLVVSHDRCFMDRVCSHILELQGAGKWQLHHGNWSDWRERATAQQRAEKAAKAQAEVAKNTVQRQGEQGDAPPKPSWAELRRLEGIEAEVETAESAVTAAEEALEQPEIAADYSKLQDAAAALATATATRDEAYAAWQQIEDKQALWAAHKNVRKK